MANYKAEAALIAAAEKAGKAAGDAATPTPMVVSTRNGDKVWTVPDGPCGFAWVNVKPGNSRVANYLKKSGKGRGDSYAGGVTVWVGEYGQSVTRKAEYARAYAKVLRDADINAYSSSRLD